METSSTSHETHDFLFSSSLYSVAFLFRQPVVDVCLSIKTCAAGAHRAELSMQVNHHLSRTKMHLPAFSQFFFVLLVFAPTMVPISDLGLSNGCLVSISKSCVGRVSVFKSIFLVSICCCVPILPSGCRVVFLAPATRFSGSVYSLEGRDRLRELFPLIGSGEVCTMTTRKRSTATEH